MKYFLCLFSGVLIGGSISWPGIFYLDNWKCFNKIVEDSRDKKISLKAILTVSPKYIFRGIPDDNFSKFRIVSDACFR